MYEGQTPHCINGMNGHPNQMPESSFNSQRNYSSLSVLSGLLNTRLFSRIQPSWVMLPVGNFNSSFRGQMGSRYRRWCFLRVHEMKWGELLFGLLGYRPTQLLRMCTTAFSFARHCWCIHLMLHTRNDEQEWEKSWHYWKFCEVAVRGEVVEEKCF